MFFFCFLMKMCSMMVFITILFDSFFTLLLVFSRSCVSSFALVSQRFIQKTIVRLSVCVCVCFTSACVSALFSFLGVYLWLAVCVVLLQYQIANMVQISQINLICFSSFFFVKIHYDFSSSSFLCVAALYNLAYQVLY